MTQSTSYPSSHGPDSFNATDVSLLGVDAGVVHHTFQAGQHGHCLTAVTDLSHATRAGPNPPLIASAALPQQPSEASSASSFLPQAPKRVAEDLQDPNVKRIKIGSGKIVNDPLFKPVLNRCGQYDGDYFMCSKDGLVIRPGNYEQHIKTARHLDHELMLFGCPRCRKTFARQDVCKRHWDDICGKLAAHDGVQLSYSAACKASISFASASPMRVPTASSRETLTITSDSSLQEITRTEATKDTPEPDPRAASEIQDPPLVTPVLPEGQDIAFAEVHDTLAGNAIDDPALVAPVLRPSEVQDTTPAEAYDASAIETQDPTLVTPVLPLSEGQDISLAEVHDTLAGNTIDDPALVATVLPLI
ncbi:uncharacterized protein EDB93DRAFT_780345 [Suillus bovinus]|uniref:uncharacterized protein n=1 Tax=Suillus bovinus TaxID=48563 RepID=UPI001B867C5C|nr:uncharacterized protein EDB93DRAFT_780345 [Suillus bovinus]KAG2136492.1 hypothetical protein EDB93DRAFT_780345 [Suillus bovinus]